MGLKCCKCKKKEKKDSFEEQIIINIDKNNDILDSNNNDETKNDSNYNNNINKEYDNKPKEDIKEEKKLMPYEIVLKDYLDEEIDGNDVFDRKWYSDLEKDKIIYSKRSILALIKAAFDDKNEEFQELYNKAPLVVYIKSNGSFITDEFQVVRSVYTINKNVLPPNTSIRIVSKYLNYTKERSSWDPQIKTYKVIEGNEEGKEIKCIVQNWLKSPMFLVSERDIVEKRFEFYHEGKFYSCESSVNDDYYPLGEKVTRINDIIFIEELYEENDNIILKALTQMNTKLNLPQVFINATLSNKLLDFYKGLENAINIDYNEGNLIYEDNNEKEILNIKE